MNFPVGEIVSKGSVPFNFFSFIEEYSKKKFNGYIIQSIYDNFIEEGVMFFREGELFACCVECMSLNKLIKGDEAFSYFLNQTKGKGLCL